MVFNELLIVESISQQLLETMLGHKKKLFKTQNREDESRIFKLTLVVIPLMKTLDTNIINKYIYFYE